MKCPSEVGRRHPEKAVLWEGGCWGQKSQLWSSCPAAGQADGHLGLSKALLPARESHSHTCGVQQVVV